MTQKRRNKLILISSIACALIVIACSTVPLTGRKQLLLVPETEMIATSFTQYNSFLNENKISTDTQNEAMVKRVGSRIAAAVDSYMTQNGLGDRIEGFDWEFNLIEDNAVNAWCMPGGKVVVYTGLLPVTEDETGLAVVMGHEIAHAIARHGSERMGQQMGVQGLGTALGVALANKPAETQSLWMGVFGVTSQVGVMLPFSRKHELEADQLGLVFMAMAGYNPEAAVPFWSRMAQSGGEKPSELLSTHPSDENRIKEIQRHMPTALEFYKK